MAKMPDRRKVKREYLAGGVSYRDLAKKYNISDSTVKRWAKEDNWQDAKDQTDTKINTEMPEAVAAQQKRLEADVITLADELLQRLANSLEYVGTAIMDPKLIRGYAAALKDIREIRGEKSKLDTKEQKARIKRLDQETKRIKQEMAAKQADAGGAVIELEGMDDYAG